MGHDIYAYKIEERPANVLLPDVDPEPGEELAYLRRSAFNPLNLAIYDALGAHEHYAVVSGGGTSEEYTANQLVEALDRLPGGEEYEPERDFLTKCIDSGEPAVRISFY